MTAGLEGMEVPLRVAVMGCVVNGPGEAREADLGVASGNGKGQIFVKGEVIKTVPESKIVETLIEEAMRIAEEMEPVDGDSAARRSPSAEPHSAGPAETRVTGTPDTPILLVAVRGHSAREGMRSACRIRSGTGDGWCRSPSA